jgi:hypothetical protein
LAAIRQIFERVRAAYGACRGTWIAADFEAWERDHTVITEFGFAELKWSPVDEEQKSPPTDAKSPNGTQSSATPKAPGDQKLQPVITRTGHWIVKENQSYRNGEFCQDNRDVYTHACSFLRLTDIFLWNSGSHMGRARFWHGTISSIVYENSSNPNHQMNLFLSYSTIILKT